MNLTNEVRELAKSNYYQTLFSNAKEINIQIFRNQSDFSDLQIMFLTYLNFYKILLNEIGQYEVPELVLKKHIYEDAYMMYRKENYRKQKNSKKSTPKVSSNKKGKDKVTKDWRIDMHKGKMK